MVDDANNLVLEHLGHIRGTVDNIRAEMKHFIMRMGIAERNVVSLHVADVSQNVEIDRKKKRDLSESSGGWNSPIRDRAVACAATLRL